MTAPEIRAGERADLDAIEALETEAFKADRLDRRALRHALTSSTILALVAAAGESRLGYALVELRRGSGVARLTSLAVTARAAGQGIGRRLVEACAEGARARGADRLRLEVRADNARAIRLYEAIGFRHIGTRPDYYEDGGAAVRMERELG
ncbi:MAG: GNAT family N-acetyltransferase [Methylobacteriaceae bacterium]|nr:GNAT family N-acetyltransferase [Methylobacteriaceae bacterium]